MVWNIFLVNWEERHWSLATLPWRFSHWILREGINDLFIWSELLSAETHISSFGVRMYAFKVSLVWRTSWHFKPPRSQSNLHCTGKINLHHKNSNAWVVFISLNGILNSAKWKPHKFLHSNWRMSKRNNSKRAGPSHEK